MNNFCTGADIIGSFEILCATLLISSIQAIAAVNALRRAFRCLR